MTSDHNKQHVYDVSKRGTQDRGQLLCHKSFGILIVYKSDKITFILCLFSASTLLAEFSLLSTIIYIANFIHILIVFTIDVVMFVYIVTLCCSLLYFFILLHCPLHNWSCVFTIIFFLTSIECIHIILDFTAAISIFDHVPIITIDSYKRFCEGLNSIYCLVNFLNLVLQRVIPMNLLQIMCYKKTMHAFKLSQRAFCHKSLSSFATTHPCHV